MRLVRKPSRQPTYSLAIAAHVALVMDTLQDMAAASQHLCLAQRARAIYHEEHAIARTRAAGRMRAEGLPEEFAQAALGDLTALDIEGGNNR